MENTVKKPKKEKKYIFRRFFKDIKRVRWPSSKTNWSSFAKIVVFTVIFAVIALLFATLLTIFWKKIGI